MTKTTSESTVLSAPPPGLRRIAADVVRDLWRARTPLVVFEVAFKCTVITLGALGAGWVLAPLIAHTGRSAVTNTEIARFLLSPAGILYLVLIALALVLATLLEHVGVIAIAATQIQGGEVTVRRTFATLAAMSVRVVSVGARGVGMLAVLCAPFVVLGGIAYLVLLSRHDINYYLEGRPPSWYVALGIGVGLAAAMAFRVAVLYVSTIFVVPILLFGGHSVGAAIRESRAHSEGARLRIGVVLLGWQIIGSLLGVALVWGFGRACARLLQSAEARPIALVPLVAALLAAHALLVAAASFLLVAVHCLLILRFYLARGGSLSTAPPAESSVRPTAAAPRPARSRILRFPVLAILAVLGYAGYLAFGLTRRLEPPPPFVVVAHRGCSRAAPENTLSAFRKAIEIGADVAELDVQETADGVIVVAHDRDFMRTAGDSRRIAEITFADARKLDLGSRFSPEFAGERLPTLAELIALARGKIKLQIELKYYGKDRGLARKVAELIRRENFESECEVSSLDYDGLLKAREANPRLRLVALVTYALGDPGRLHVDALSVNTEVLSDRLIRAVKRRGKDLYAWTVDDPRAMVRLVERGVGGLVTNAPEQAIQIRRERAALGDFERRILAARYLLGLEVDTDTEPATSSPPEPARQPGPAP
jgi:glycerophosphoryl diester phosphodiesterase